MTRSNLTPAEIEALDDLEHECDLIGVTPRPHEIEWALSRVRAGELGQ